MLSKRECRKCADPGVTLDPNNGLLHAQQVKYIISTEVKIICGLPVLVLHFFSRKRAVEGDCRPVWTMFQSQTDYTTLERDPDGKTKWRTASFQNLTADWNFDDYCAFYTSADEQRVNKYFHADNRDTGFGVLTTIQNAILEIRLNVRKRRKESKILARMEGIPSLPDGLESWARQNVLPAYFFYDHAKKGIAAGVCTSCGGENTLTGVKHNAKDTCPSCGRKIMMKPRGRIGRLNDRATGQVIQRIGPDELLVRIIKAHCTYKNGTPAVNVYENARQFIRVDTDGSVHSDRYYLHDGGILTDWKAGVRPSYMYGTSFEAETCGHVYCGNLPEALQDTPWQYCPIDLFYQHFKTPMAMYDLLFAYLTHPRLEHLIKIGFYNIAADMVYHYYKADLTLDEGQNRTHRILNVAAEDVAFLREVDPSLSALKVYREYCQQGMKDRQQLFRWQLEHGVKNNIDPLLGHMTAHRMIRYLDKQFERLKSRKSPSGALRYGSMQELVTEYADYLDMCGKQHYDLSNSFVLYPKDLQVSHDTVAQRIKAEADAKLRQEFQAAYQRVAGQLDFQQNGLQIVYPTSPDDVIAEGQALHHCVGGYLDRVARQECVILFLRHCDDASKPFYTIEVRGRKVVQVRGMLNGEPTPEVTKFVSAWKKNVLQRDLDAELAA